MTSTLVIYRKDADMRGEREIACFKMPIKWYFGRRFCGTDGSIGCNADVTDRVMIECVDECRAMTNINDSERQDLDKLEEAALKGHHFRIEWQH